MSESDKASRFALIILTTLCITYIVENFLRSAAGALTPVLISELGITHGAMGLLTTAFFLVYGLMQVPAGLLGDSYGPRKTIIWSTAVTVVGVFLFWINHSYIVLFVAQFLVGIGSSTFYINSVKLMLEWFPRNWKATAVGIMSASSGIGNTLAYMGFPLIYEAYGDWRAFYLLMGIILLLNWVMNLFLLKDKNHANGGIKLRDMLDSVIRVIKNPDMRLYIIAYAFRSTNFVFGVWMTQFLIDTKGFTYVQAGQITSFGTLAAIPGCILVAAISDRLRKRKTPLLFFAFATFAANALLILLPAGTSLIIFSAVNAVMYISVGYWVLFFSMVPEVLPSNESGIGLGLINAVCTLGISLLSPVYGGLVDSTGGYLTSNLLMLLGALLVPLIMLKVKDPYGGLKK
jgi:MFS family permease